MAGTVLTIGILQPERQTAKLDSGLRTSPAVVCLLLAPALFAQPTAPGWLALYPGAAARTRAYLALTTATYTTDAPPRLVTAHYRRLFEARHLAFVPNPDGVGVTVRGSVPECDLLIAIRPHDYGTAVAVNCAARISSEATGAEVMPVRVIGGGPAAIQERHSRRLAALAPLPVWPDWLAPFEGGNLTVRTSADAAGNPTMTAGYLTSQPLSRVVAFYKSLLAAHGYSSQGLAQNADTIQGRNYPNEIDVSFARTRPNQPISVLLRLTAR